MTAPDLAAIARELTPYPLTVEEQCRAREAFGHALLMQLRHLHAKVATLSPAARREVAEAAWFLIASIAHEDRVADRQRAVAEALLTPDFERSDDLPQTTVEQAEAASTVSDRHMPGVGV